MKYRKHEAKEAARSMLQGVWTALPYNFTADDKLDEAAIAFNLEHSISKLKVGGHYCSGNVAEFWALTNEERMQAHEINAESTGRFPDRRLPPPESVRSGKALPASRIHRHRFRDHPDALPGSALR
jgi:hypothetical protein